MSSILARKFLLDIGMVALVASVFLTACSGTFEKQATSFQVAMNSMASSFDEYRALHSEVTFNHEIQRSIVHDATYNVSKSCEKEVRRGLLSILQQRLEAGENLSRIDTEIARAKAILKDQRKLDCFVTWEGNSRNGTFKKIVQAEKGAKLADVLRSYAGNLAELARSEDIEGVKSSAASLQAQLVSLSKVIGPQGGSPSAAQGLVNPLTSAALWIGTKYLERQRYLYLRDTVREADPLIRKAASILSLETIIFHQAIAYNDYQIRKAEASALVDVQSPIERLGHLQHVLVRQESLRSLIKKDPTKAFIAMANAHAELLKALNENEPSSTEAFAEIEAFAQIANDLLVAVKKLKSG